MTERVSEARACILHQRPYRETSLLVEVFSQEHGRVGIVAKGARRPKSRLRSLLQPLQEVSLSWHQRGDLASLREAELLGSISQLKGDALFAGFYMNELILRLCVRGDPHPELYLRYRECLDELAADLPPGWVLRLFERDLLETIGYGLRLDLEGESHTPIKANLEYDFHPSRGAVRLDSMSEHRGTAVSGAALLALHSGDLSDTELRRQAKQVLRPAINALLDNRPLRSVETLRQMRAGSLPQESALSIGGEE